MLKEKIIKILIGSNNNGKIKEIRDLLPKNISVFSPKNFKIKSPVEKGKSFKENSIIKAKYFSKKTNLICMSDDSGLEIDVLNGAPGIYSSRWSGKKNDFNLAIKKVYREINKNNWKSNNARFICCLALLWPDGKIYVSKGIVNGKISDKKRGTRGFGYDPIFIPEGYDKTFGEMNPKLKMSIDHRFRAFTQLKRFFS